ncbi:MAG: hypothetical protein P1V97_04855 [Planctomycetota bacterium]|nr:hypothetical protein [Planctomycetota bacterium]
MMGLSPYEVAIIAVVWLLISFGPVVAKVAIALVRRWSGKEPSN